MNRWAKNGNAWIRRLAVVIVMGGIVLAGCSKKPAGTEQGSPGGDTPGQAVAPADAGAAGCPLGTGENVSGSIGYWLKPECDEQQDPVLFEEGALGACRGDEKDTAATRFYITLTRAPYLAGNYTVFGKVARGLDVV